jgi:hypothetical protein
MELLGAVECAPHQLSTGRFVKAMFQSSGNSLKIGQDLERAQRTVAGTRKEHSI